MRRTAIAVAFSVSVLSLFGDVKPAHLIGPDLVVQKPAITTSASGYSVITTWTAAWSVRNAGNQPSPATQLKVACTPVYLEGDGGCTSAVQMVAVPPIAPGDSFSAQAAVFFVHGIMTPAHRYRFSIVATVNPTHAFKELDERNNQTSFIVENFQGAPPPPVVTGGGAVSSSAPPRSNAGPEVSAGNPTNQKLLPHMELTTDPKSWSFNAPFWVVLKNVDPTIDAKDVVVTAKCEAKTASGLTGCLYAPGPASLTIPSIPHGSFKALYQVQPPSTYGVAGTRMTFHVDSRTAIATDLVLNTIK